MTSTTRRTRVAVIGSGAAGLGAAFLLARGHYDVDLFEADSRPGGHANTVDIPLPNVSPPVSLPVDTGFIVYNTRTYPDLVSLFELLGVEEENSSMSFASSVHLPSSSKAFEWGSDNLSTLFADQSNLYRPVMYSMIYDMTRFNAAVHDFISKLTKDPESFKDRNITLKQFLDNGAYSQVFIHAYLIPMISAVWSSSFQSALLFPARSLFHFFVNHGLAQVFNRPQWRTPAKRSRDYVTKLLADFRKHHGKVHLSSPVVSVVRKKEYCTLCVKGSSNHMRFDQVIFATHAPDTLKILGDDATDDERRILSKFEYSTNVAHVHTDEALMPNNKTVWSSWNFIGRTSGVKEKATLEKATSTAASDDSGSGASDISSDTATTMDKDEEPATAIEDTTCESDDSNTCTKANTKTSQQNSNATRSDENNSIKEEQFQLLDVVADDNDNDNDNNDDDNDNDNDNNDDDNDPVCVSYWLNRLQNYHKFHLPVPDLFITLNPIIPIQADKILLSLSYDHPQFTEAAVNAQSQLQADLQGKNRTWFCGAYTRYGFHEDAIMSGFDVAEKLSNSILRPWRMKNYLAINDNSKQYNIPISSSSSSPISLMLFVVALMVIDAVIARLQIGLGKIAARMTDHDPVVVVASGEGRLHRFGPKHVRRIRSSFFSFSQLSETNTTSSTVVDDDTQPSAARITVRSPTVLARIADALRQGSVLAPVAAAAFAAGELDCPSPTDLSESLRSLFIAHALDDPSNARKGRAKLAENLLSSIVGKFDHVRSMREHTRLPELTTCMLNVVCPSWWLELEDSGNSSSLNDGTINENGCHVGGTTSTTSNNNDLIIHSKSIPKSLKSAVSPHDLNDVSRILELDGDLSELTVAFLKQDLSRRATIAVKTNERIGFVKYKAEFLAVSSQVTVVLLDQLRKLRETGFGLSEELDNDETKFDLVFSPGIINCYKCDGFKSARQVLEFIHSLCAPNAVIELGVVVYGSRQKKSSAEEKKFKATNAIFSGNEGYRLWDIPDVMQLSDVNRFDLQKVAFLNEEEAALDIHEVIQRVYNILAVDQLEPGETRSVLAQMCLWQAALGVKYLRRMAVSFTLR